MQPFWPFCYDIAIIDDMVMKGRRTIIPMFLQRGTFEQLHINYMDIEKTRLLAHESIYWVNINNVIENAIEDCLTRLAFQAT